MTDQDLEALLTDTELIRNRRAYDQLYQTGRAGKYTELKKKSRVQKSGFVERYPCAAKYFDEPKKRNSIEECRID